jgi:hypothetical protein
MRSAEGRVDIGARPDKYRHDPSAVGEVARPIRNDVQQRPLVAAAAVNEPRDRQVRELDKQPLERRDISAMDRLDRRDGTRIVARDRHHPGHRRKTAPRQPRFDEVSRQDKIDV